MRGFGYIRRFNRKSVLTTGLLLASPALLAGDWHNRWQQQWAVTDNNTQKFEGQLTFEWNHGFANNTDLTAITRLSLDTENRLNNDTRKPDNYSNASAPWYRGEHGSLELSELYLDAEWLNAYWRVGKQQVVWGQADGLKVLDVVTPQSFREFILDAFDESRIPLWMINVEIPLGNNSNLQWLWIPDTTYHELAEIGTSFEITSPLRVPAPPVNQTFNTVVINEAELPNNELTDSDTGLKYSTFWQGWDITANYFYHYRNFAVPYQRLAQQQITITPTYERSHLVGTTASNAFGDFTLRTEIGWFSHSFHVAQFNQSNNGIEQSEEISSVIGLDWQGLADTFISGQWFQSHLPNHKSPIIRDKTEHTVSLLAEQTYLNETWTLRLQGIYSVNRGDYLIRPKLSHLLYSQLELWVGADLFAGDNQGLYGQFDEQDRVYFGFELGF